MDGTRGERVLVERYDADSDGPFLRVESWLPGGAAGPPAHVHPDSEERVRVVSGHLALTVDGERTVLDAGDERAVPAGTPHRLENAGEDPVVCSREIRPPMGRETGFEAALAAYFGLANAGELDADGRAGLLAEAAFVARYGHVVRPADGLPRRVLLALLGPLARRRVPDRGYLDPPDVDLAGGGGWPDEREHGDERDRRAATRSTRHRF